ncbi:MAG: hypothetical protein ABH846_02835 [Patescibacteria group bacterium]
MRYIVMAMLAVLTLGFSPTAAAQVTISIGFVAPTPRVCVGCGYYHDCGCRSCDPCRSRCGTQIVVHTPPVVMYNRPHYYDAHRPATRYDAASTRPAPRYDSYRSPPLRYETVRHDVPGRQVRPQSTTTTTTTRSTRTTTTTTTTPSHPRHR